MFDTSVQVKLADFGLSTQLPSPTARVVFTIGTVGFSAPEMYKKEPSGLAFDIWSLGAVLFFMLTSKVPFYHPEKKQLKRRVCFGNFH